MVHVPEHPSSPSHAKVIVLGIDGMDPTLLEQYLAKGSMPHFARLRAQGLYTRLRTTTPPESPVAWSTFATGCNPGKHGLFDFVKRVPGTYLPDLALTRIEGSRTWRNGRAIRFGRSRPPIISPRSSFAVPLRFPRRKSTGACCPAWASQTSEAAKGRFCTGRPPRCRTRSPWVDGSSRWTTRANTDHDAARFDSGHWGTTQRLDGATHDHARPRPADRDHRRAKAEFHTQRARMESMVSHQV